MKKSFLILVLFLLPFTLFSQIYNLRKVKEICYLHDVDTTSKHYVLLVYSDTATYTVLVKRRKNREVVFQKDTTGLTLRLIPVIYKVYFVGGDLVSSDELSKNEYYQNSWSIGYYRAKGIRKWMKLRKSILN